MWGWSGSQCGAFMSTGTHCPQQAVPTGESTPGCQKKNDFNLVYMHVIGRGGEGEEYRRKPPQMVVVGTGGNGCS